MPYSNTHKNARISPKKVKLVVDMIRGKPLGQALSMLEQSKKRAAVMVKASLLAARANADQAEADVRKLIVSDARVDKGVVLKRIQPKDRGRGFAILKRCSHITVAVDVK